jgi:hypothetical protein
MSEIFVDFSFGKAEYTNTLAGQFGVFLFISLLCVLVPVVAITLYGKISRGNKNINTVFTDAVFGNKVNTFDGKGVLDSLLYAGRTSAAIAGLGAVFSLIAILLYKLFSACLTDRGLYSTLPPWSFASCNPTNRGAGYRAINSSVSLSPLDFKDLTATRTGFINPVPRSWIGFRSAAHRAVVEFFRAIWVQFNSRAAIFASHCDSLTIRTSHNIALKGAPRLASQYCCSRNTG